MKKNKYIFTKTYIILYVLSIFYFSLFETRSSEIRQNNGQQKLENKIKLVENNNTVESTNNLEWKTLNNKFYNKNKLKWEVLKDQIIDNSEARDNKNKTFEQTMNKLEEEELKFVFTDLGLIVPTAYVLREGDFRLYLNQQFPLEKGPLEKGSGNQNYAALFNLGLTDSSMFSGFFSIADDPLYKKINSVEAQPENKWLSIGTSFKWKFFERNNFKFAFDNSFELWQVKSGGCMGIGCKNESSNIFDKSLRKADNTNIIGTTSLPLTWDLYKKTNFSLSPRITFLPNKQSVGNILGEFYGVNYGLGIGVSYIFHPKLSLYASNYFPIGGGNNTFDENINFKKSIIYDYGFNYALDTKISFRTYISNSFGGTPSTSILTIPSSNEPILGTRIIYTPSGYEFSLDKKNSSAKFQSGLSVSTTNLLGTNVNYFDISYDSFGSYWTTYRVGLSKTFDFEAVSGSASNNVDQKNKYVKNYLNDDEQTLRFGGRGILFSENNGFPFTSGFRLTFGRSLGEEWQGYLFAENINSKDISERITFNLSPKIAMTGLGDLFSIGTSINWKLRNNIFIIPEANIAIDNSNSNWSISLRYLPGENYYFDFYSSTAFNFVDLGELINSKDPQLGFKFGIKI